jgi:hypothetical protein
MKKSDYVVSGEKAETIVAEIGGKAGTTRFDSFREAAKLV